VLTLIILIDIDHDYLFNVNIKVFFYYNFIGSQIKMTLVDIEKHNHS